MIFVVLTVRRPGWFMDPSAGATIDPPVKRRNTNTKTGG